MYKVYFAGDLFDQKHITGNFLLAEQIEKISQGIYRCMLPQNWEGASLSKPLEIRNKDIASILRADFVLFNFDGTDLDSGTVVEFMLAKMLDVPSVLLRTDPRDSFLPGYDWNLMASGYPRCVIVKHSALKLYNEVGLTETHCIIAQSIINAFKKVVQEKSLLTSYEEIFAAYQHVIKMCGGDFSQSIPLTFLQEIIIAKIKNKIYSFSDIISTTQSL